MRREEFSGTRERFKYAYGNCRGRPFNGGTLSIAAKIGDVAKVGIVAQPRVVKFNPCPVVMTIEFNEGDF